VVLGEGCGFEIIQDHLQYNHIYLYHIGIIAQANSLEGVCQQLQQAASAALEWGRHNSVKFDPGKTEAVLFNRGTRQGLREGIRQARMAGRGSPN
jgi:hypothetical protein